MKLKNKIKNKFKDRAAIKKFLLELLCIAIGTIVGITTYVICLYTHFAIFGWNFGLVLAPLFAGYAESFCANKIVHESTGAISAFILFLITVIYGFIISNNTLGFNIITAGSIVIIIQAAIPTATNYFLISMALGIISHVSGIFKKFWNFLSGINHKIMRKMNLTPRITKESNIRNRMSLSENKLDINNRGVSFFTTEYPPEDKTVLESKGIFEAREIFTFKMKEEVKSINENDLDVHLLVEVKIAENKALLKLIKDLRQNGCNALLNFHMTFETLGSEKGQNLMQIVVRGTGLVFEEEDLFLS